MTYAYIAAAVAVWFGLGYLLRNVEVKHKGQEHHW